MICLAACQIGQSQIYAYQPCSLCVFLILTFEGQK